MKRLWSMDKNAIFNLHNLLLKLKLYSLQIFSN
jgi:hypothetical protein